MYRVIVILCLVGGLGSLQPVLADEVNVYSARKENLIKPLLDRFTEQTGVNVNLVTAKADALLLRLEAEGPNSPADVFITVDAGRLFRAKQAGVLEAVTSEVLETAVPAHMKDPQGFWYGLSFRVRPIMFAHDRVSPDQLSSYEDLADPKWAGRICIRSSSNIYNQSLIASMIAVHGETKTEEWLSAFVENFARPPQGGDTDQLKAVAAGECDIAIANNYYLGRLHYAASSDADKQAGEKLSLFWPNQQNRGAHVNVSGAGITKASKNRKNALRLLEFLVSDEAQAWYAGVNYEYPVKLGIDRSVAVNGYGNFKADTVTLSVLGENNALAVKLMDRAGWK